MHGTLPATHPLLIVGCGRTGLSLRCLRGFAPAGPLLVLAAGIECGRLDLPAMLEPDTVLDLPLRCLPLLPLPAMLRLACEADGAELAQPWPLEGPEMALSLLGSPCPTVSDLRLEHGVLRGTAIEPANGLLQPVMYARVNGAVARAVAVDPPVGRPEGGCAFRFALPLQPSDLTEAGLTATLHLVGQETPLARYDWARAGAGAAEAGLARLEARLVRMEEAQQAAMARLAEATERRLALQQERIDAFIEATTTLLLDRLAGPGDTAGDRRAELHGLIATLAQQPAMPAAAPPRRHEVGPHAPQFGSGWHAPEDPEEGSFRWMSASGVLVNPAPERAVTAVLVEIPYLYRMAEPALEAHFTGGTAGTGVAGRTSAVPHGHGFTLRILPDRPAGAGPLQFETLRLVSRISGCPAREGVSADQRVLSAAISRVVFLYAE